MQSLKNQQNQKLTNQLKLFNDIYNRKFRKQNIEELAQRRRVVASQLKPAQSQFLQTFQQQVLAEIGKSKRKTVGSLLPRLSQIQLITQTDKSNKLRQKSNSLTKLQIYLSNKNIKKQEQYNMLFITQNNSVVPDKLINQKFCQFVAVYQEQRPKNLRALLNLTSGFQLSQQSKRRKIQESKKQITQIMKGVIQEHHRQQHKHDQQILENEDEQQSKDQNKNQKQQNKIVQKQKQKGIQWVLKECKKYNKKFRVDKKSKSQKKIIKQ